MDAKAEMEKLDKRQALAISNKEKLQKTIDALSYQSTVKDEVRTANVEKMDKFDAEIESIRLAIERFQSLL